MKKLFFAIAILATFFTNVANAQLVPLKQFWNGSRADNFLTTDAQVGGYDFVREEGFAEAKPGKGLKPLILLWNDKNDNFTTASGDRVQHATGVGYKQIRTICYVWQDNIDGTMIPLKLFWSGDRTDNYTTASSDGERDALAAGYIFAGIEGYIKTGSTTSKVAKDLWLSVFSLYIGRDNSYFKLNNFTEKTTSDNTFKYYKPNDTQVKFGSGRNQFSKQFDIQPLRFEPLTVYVKNIEGAVDRLEVEGNRLKVIVNFESDDIEIATNCIDNLGCGALGNPNFHLDNMSLILFVEPYAENGQIKLRNFESRLTGNLSPDGVNFIVDHIRPFLEFGNSTIFNLFSNGINRFLNDPNNISQWNNAINTAVGSGVLLGVSNPYFTSIRIDEYGNLVYSLR